MDLQSNDLLLFYNNDIYNPHHFGLLLAELEYDGLIQENEITFGVKSSSVIFERVERGGHEWDLPTTVNTRIIRRKTKSGKEDEVVIQDSLELVLAIRARDEEHAVKLAKFFNERTKLSASLQGEAAIDGSWVVPDIRATNNLSEFLIEHAGYIPVIANLGRMGELV